MLDSVGALAAVVGGGFWILGFLGVAVLAPESPWPVVVLLAATALLAVSMIHRRREGGSGSVASLGTGVAAVAAVAFGAGVALVAADARIPGIAAWDLMWFSFLGLMTGAILFAAGTFGDLDAPRTPIALVGIGAAVQTAVLIGLMTGFLATPWPSFVGALAFGAGWVGVGLSGTRSFAGPAAAGSAQ
jgi:hypothetical protein